MESYVIFCFVEYCTGPVMFFKMNEEIYAKTKIYI